MGAGVIHNDAALRRQVEELTREHDALRARLDAAEEALEWIRCESTDVRAEKAVADYFDEFRPDANRGHAETAQGASAEPTVASGGAPRMPVPPTPTAPAAEASEVEALARDLYAEAEKAWNTKAYPWDNQSDERKEANRHIARHVLRREAALRERAEKAEAEVARLRDPERERLIAEFVELHGTAGAYGSARDAGNRLKRYERERRAKEKP